MAWLFEKELKVSFTETNLSILQKELPRLFEKLEISKDTSIEANNTTATIRIARAKNPNKSSARAKLG